MMSGLLDGTSTLQSGPETKRPRTSLWSVSWVAAGRERRCVRSGRVLRVDPAPHRDRPQGAGGPAQEAHRSGDLGVGCDLPGGPDSGQPTVDPPQEHARQPMPAGRSPEAWPPANAYRMARSRKLSSIRVLVGPAPFGLKPRTGARSSW